MIVGCVHGFMGDPSDWEMLRTQSPSDKIVTPLIRPAENWHEGVSALAAEIPEGALLVGYSMGARLCLALALSHPQRYRGLVFCSGNPGLEDDQEREDRYTQDCRIAQRIAEQDRDEFLAYWYSSPVFRSLSPAVRQQEIQRKRARCGDDWGSILKCYSIALQPNFWPQLSNLAIPCLAIAGALDQKYASIVARMESIPGMQTSIVPACGHIVHHEQPQAFQRLLCAFQRSLLPG